MLAEKALLIGPFIERKNCSKIVVFIINKVRRTRGSPYNLPNQNGATVQVVYGRERFIRAECVRSIRVVDKPCSMNLRWVNPSVLNVYTYVHTG